MNLFFQPRISDGISYLDEEESRHCVKVLRKRDGDIIQITDGKGFFYEAILEDVSPKQCGFRIEKKTRAPVRDFSIHIALSPIKNTDRIEWFVEKAVEIGIDKISLIDCDHTERSFVKLERLTKVAISAMKQSLKARIPEIVPLSPLKQLLLNPGTENRFIAYVDPTNPVHLKNTDKRKDTYLVLIGPEGDFSKDELELAVEKGFIQVSLGASRLRTETAALAACLILNLINS